MGVAQERQTKIALVISEDDIVSSNQIRYLFTLRTQATQYCFIVSV